MPECVILFLQTLCMVGIAEMGDKTQLVVIALTKKYRVGHIVLGVLLAILADNLIAVVFGKLLAGLLNPVAIQIASGLLFLYFAVSSVKSEGEEQSQVQSRLGPVLGIGMTFFLAEFGDKTQLATANLVAVSVVPHAGLAVLLGATAGMVAANLLALVFGLKLGKHIPDAVFRWLSVGVFALFGIAALHAPMGLLLGRYNGNLTVLGIVAMAFLAGLLVYRKDKKGAKKYASDYYRHW